jgi:hypothetical protein
MLPHASNDEIKRETCSYKLPCKIVTDCFVGTETPWAHSPHRYTAATAFSAGGGP